MEDFLNKAFETFDKDQDGQITFQELDAAAAEWKTQGVAFDIGVEQFKEADTDGDGFITREELIALYKKYNPQ